MIFEKWARATRRLTASYSSRARLASPCSSGGGRTASMPASSRLSFCSRILSCWLMLPQITIHRSVPGMVSLLSLYQLAGEQGTLQLRAAVVPLGVEGDEPPFEEQGHHLLARRNEF